MKISLDNRSFFQKLWCKLFHRDEEFIDTRGSLNYKVVSLGHKCFRGSFLIRKCWVENRFNVIIK
jgi:hypothetical protein